MDSIISDSQAFTQKVKVKMSQDCRGLTSGKGFGESQEINQAFAELEKEFGEAERCLNLFAKHYSDAKSALRQKTAEKTAGQLRLQAAS